MNLHFVCRWEGECEPPLTADFNSQFRMAIEEVVGCTSACDSDSSGGAAGLKSNGAPFVFRLEFECIPQDDPLEQARQLVEVLSQLSLVHSLACSVGHQMEQRIGSISNGNPDAKLEDELGTSIRVAHALGQIIAEDEWLEEDEHEDAALDLEQQEVGLESDLANDEAWSGLLDTSEDFVRFPKFDDQ